MALVDAEGGAALLPHVPHAQRRVARAREEDVRLDGRPLDVLDRRAVPRVRLRVDDPAAGGRGLPNVDGRLTVA
eukprot:2554206-Prymnesium_polylepis.1